MAVKITSGAPASPPATVFIVGAGFSAHAGLPLATQFTESLLNVSLLKEGGPSRAQVELIRHFVQATFDHGPATPSDLWPDLEDLFTGVDLSANTGHHLGAEFSPAVLRTVRRALIVRTVRMLNQRYTAAIKKNGASLRSLNAFFGQVEPAACAFLSMNWDTVIERGLANAHGVTAFDYGCGAQPASFEGRGLSLAALGDPTATVLKPHGSVNWLYCDACRHVVWVPADQTEKVAGQLFGARDWETVQKFTGKSGATVKPASCPTCEAQALGTRIATFSYRKALEFPMHARTWQTAEELLYGACNWVFIGYSLPAADYEFKHLLKRVQVSRGQKPNIVLVTGGGAEGAERTRAAYQKFFGPTLASGGDNVFLNGLDETALEGLAGLGCLSKSKRAVTPVATLASKPKPKLTPRPKIAPPSKKGAAAKPVVAKAPRARG
jgi:hypothetical protein